MEDEVSRSVEVSCPCETVFAVLADVDRLPEFSDMTVQVRGPGRPLQVGDTFEQRIRVAGVPMATRWVVREVDPPHRQVVEGSAFAGGRAVLEETLTPAGGGCRVELTVRYALPLGPLGALLDRLVIRRRSAMEAERILGSLKELCERPT